MPKYILKPDPDLDLYVEWSTIVDNLTAVGTRKEFHDAYIKDIANGIDPHWKPKRFERADLAGTSSFDGDFGWDDDGGIVHNMTEREDLHAGWLPREKFAQYCALYSEGKVLEAENLVEPFEDED